ncbi:MAG: hypothetical protein K2N64_02155, partial [Anaeroplasmataceae bacterium]|nr:hypothetical protein [Anaeroplasmataceae bacterium]
YKNHCITIKEKTHKIKWKTRKLDSSTLLHTILIQEGKLKLQENYYEYYHPLEDFSSADFEMIAISGDFKESLNEENERILLVLKKTTAD